MKFIEKIFSVKNSKDKIHKIITICGLKLKFRCNQVGLTEDDVRKLLQANNNRLLHGVQRSITTAALHQKTFAGYKNKYQGRTFVLVGAGPTLNYFESINDAIYVGLNRTFLFEKIKFFRILPQLAQQKLPTACLCPAAPILIVFYSR